MKMLPQIEPIGFGVMNALTGKEIKLAMQRLHLRGKILPVGARLVVHHQFRSEEKAPLEVVYTFMLPKDAAMRRFRVSGENFSIHSELKKVKEAVAQYEEGIERGHLSTLARQYQDGMVSLNLGNIRPGETVNVALEILAGVELHDDGLRFRFPFTLSPCYHAKAKMVTVAPGEGEIELPEEAFDDLILPRFMEDASELHQIDFNLLVSLPQALKEVGSPSHGITLLHQGDSNCRVKLATGQDVPNRDLVLDIKTKTGVTQVLTEIGKDGKGHFALVFPSGRFGSVAARPRKVVFLLDRSGSMEGAPFNQARKAVNACLGTLNADDKFSIVVFDNEPCEFTKTLAPGDMKYRDEARDYLSKVVPRGGTELARGFTAAAGILGDSGGDIFLLTDGQVSETDEILARARATGIRIHCLGIGAASQDRFLTLLARETGGVSRFVTPKERVDISALELFAATGRPVATGLQVNSPASAEEQLVIEPLPPADVFSGNPVVVWGEAPKPGNYALEMKWTGEKGEESQEGFSISADNPGDTIKLLRGARIITDMESRIADTEDQSRAGRRREDRVTKRLESLSETFGLASRVMALVAVVERAGDRPGVLPTTRVVALGMPQDVSFDSYFPVAARMSKLEVAECMSMNASRALSRNLVDKAISMARGLFSAGSSPACPPKSVEVNEEKISLPVLLNELDSSIEQNRLTEADDLLQYCKTIDPKNPEVLSRAKHLESIMNCQINIEWLLDIAARLRPDGGFPGDSIEERMVKTLITLDFMTQFSRMTQSDPFRIHIERLRHFLESHLDEIDDQDHRLWLEKNYSQVLNGLSLAGDPKTFMGLLSKSAIWNPTEFWRFICRNLPMV
jgi:Ca-activated chloride channel homolog